MVDDWKVRRDLEHLPADGNTPQNVTKPAKIVLITSDGDGVMAIMRDAGVADCRTGMFRSRYPASRSRKTRTNTVDTLFGSAFEMIIQAMLQSQRRCGTRVRASPRRNSIPVVCRRKSSTSDVRTNQEPVLHKKMSEPGYDPIGIRRAFITDRARVSMGGAKITGLLE